MEISLRTLSTIRGPLLIGRASKLVESLILGLPVPQIFLYEQGRNSFLVIDGQQRLLSIYYFMKQRFPRKDRRVKLAAIFADHGKIPDNVLHDDEYFMTFKLRLAEKLPGHPNKLKGLNYSTFGESRLRSSQADQAFSLFVVAFDSITRS